MTLCGRILGIEKKDIAQRMKERNVTKLDVAIQFSYYTETGIDRYAVLVEEKERVNGRTAFVRDSIKAWSWKWEYQMRFTGSVRRLRTDFLYPDAMEYAFQTANLLDRAGFDVTVNGKEVKIARNECLDYIDRAVNCMMSGL